MCQISTNSTRFSMGALTWMQFCSTTPGKYRQAIYIYSTNIHIVYTLPPLIYPLSLYNYSIVWKNISRKNWIAMICLLLRYWNYKAFSCDLEGATSQAMRSLWPFSLESDDQEGKRASCSGVWKLLIVAGNTCTAVMTRS